jgi:hypothetical protein
MAIYNEHCELDLEKFDIYNLYRDQVCYLKVNKNHLNVNIDPDNWNKIKAIIEMADCEERRQALDKWFEDAAPNMYGQGKDFEFSPGLLDRIIELLKEKFEKT